MSRRAALLVPQPVTSLAYLAAVRAEWLRPSFVPILLLSLLPLAAFGLAWRPPRAPAIAIVALVELAWAVLSEAMVGFAIAWRSG